MVTSAKNGARIWFPLAARLGFACAAGLTLAWCVASFWFPFGWDQGIFASIGDVVLRGGMPYRDAWDIKGPLPHCVFALAQWLFGRHMWSIRILDLPLLLAGMAVFAFMVARLTSPLNGYWAAITLMLWMGSLTWFHTVQPDSWVAIFIVLAAAPLVARRPSLPQLLFSGVMIGCAGLVKPLYLGFVAAPLVQILGQRRSDTGWLARAGSVVGMALVPPLLALAWFANRGALRDLVDVHLLYTLQVYSGIASPGIRNDMRGILEFFLTGPVSLALPVIVVGVHSLWRDSRNSALVLLTWAVVALMCVTAQGKFFRYHWVPLFPPMLTLGVIGFQSLLLVSSNKTADGTTSTLRLLSRVALSFAVIGVLQLALVPLSSVVQWWKFVSGRIGSERYYAAYTAGRFVAGDDMKAARYIQERTSAADGVAVFGNDSLINFLSGRANPTRFISSVALTQQGGASIRAAYRREYMLGLQETPPAYIVIGVFYSSTKEVSLHGFPELEILLHDHYLLETQIGSLDLYHVRTLKSAGWPGPISK